MLRSTDRPIQLIRDHWSILEYTFRQLIRLLRIILETEKSVAESAGEHFHFYEFKLGTIYDFYFFAQVVLMAASSVFHDLFIEDLSSRSDINRQKCTSRCGSGGSGSDRPITQDRNLLSPMTTADVRSGENGESGSTVQYHDKRLDLDEHYLSISPNGNTCFITSRQLLPGEQSTRPDSRTCIGSVHFGQYLKSGESDLDQMNEEEDFSVPVSIRCLPGRLEDHPAFYSIHLQQQEEVFSGRPVLRSVVVMNRKVTPDAFRTVLQYLYTGYVNSHSSLEDVETAASLLELTDLVRIIENVKEGEEYLNSDISKLFLQHRKERMRELFLEKSILSGNFQNVRISRQQLMIMI